MNRLGSCWVVLTCFGLSHALAIDHPGCAEPGYSPRAFAMISVATFVGTWAYESNCME